MRTLHSSGTCSITECANVNGDHSRKRQIQQLYACAKTLIGHVDSICPLRITYAYQVGLSTCFMCVCVCVFMCVFVPLDHWPISDHITHRYNLNVSAITDDLVTTIAKQINLSFLNTGVWHTSLVILCRFMEKRIVFYQFYSIHSMSIYWTRCNYN